MGICEMGIYSRGKDLHKQASSEFAIRMPTRSVIRIGFSVVIALLLFSTLKAYQIQGSLSAEALQIYHRHIKQDEILNQLRRNLWIGANASRDFLLNPFLDKAATFEAQLLEVRTASAQLLDQLDHLQVPNEASMELRTRIQDFWNLLERIPIATETFDEAGRYQFVQREIVPRRNSAGAVLRELAEVNQETLKESEIEFSDTRGAATRRLLITLSLCVAFVLVIVAFSLSHSETLERQTARQYDDLEHAKKELQQLAARLMEVQEEERTRLSRELHDEIGQALAIIRLEISRAESASGADLPRDRLARARRLTEDTIQTIRNISLLLRLPFLDDLGLGPALEWQVEAFSRRTGVKCELAQQDISDLLPDTIKTCVYRVLQESLHNCEKYGAASHVNVSVRHSSGLLILSIEDYGRGFDVNLGVRPCPTSRFGILGMRERAAALGGTLDLNSAPGCGTRITLRLPFKEVERPATAPEMPVEVSVQ
jgi:signal transduction histidine kinase